MILLYPSVVAAYLAAAWLAWRQLAQAPERTSPGTETVARWLPAVALAGHAILVSAVVFTDRGPDLSLANALSAVAGLIALFTWVGSRSGALPGVAVIALPVAAAAVVLPPLFANPHPLSLTDEPWAALHIAVALAAYALLIVAALQALLLMSLERRLHRGLAARGAGPMLPLLTLERFLFRLVGLGYALLTLTLLSGIVFSEELFGKPLTLTHKTVFSVLAWLVFGALLVGRYRYGWRGRIALRWILAGSGLLLLAYLGSKFVLEVILHR
ncbi:MAG: cytochrome c biogenesis protein CcsA [Betaproteobacteria bacterium]